MRPDTGQLAPVDDQILPAHRPAVEPALEDLAASGGIAVLG
jgi:hypothetical protein